MRLRTVVGIILPALVIALWCFAETKGDAASGKEVFRRCAICHGDSGEGKEAVGKAFGVTMKPLGSKEVQALDDATLKKNIIEGNGKMRPVKLSDTEAADVIAFLRTLKK
jgi:cytochrome c2